MSVFPFTARLRCGKIPHRVFIPMLKADLFPSPKPLINSKTKSRQAHNTASCSLPPILKVFGRGDRAPLFQKRGPGISQSLIRRSCPQNPRYTPCRRRPVRRNRLRRLDQSLPRWGQSRPPERLTADTAFRKVHRTLFPAPRYPL